MSVLVKGMDMPSSCNDCLFGHWSNRYQVVFCELLNFKEYPADYTGYKAKRLDKCPLGEVPTPHGALIDKDKLVKTTLLNPRHVPYIAINDLEDQPVVIEAEVDHEYIN